jgi:hypothetical protein
LNCRHGIGEVFPAEIIRKAVGQQFLQQFADDPDGFLPLKRVAASPPVDRGYVDHLEAEMDKLREENARLRSEVAFLQPQASTSAGHSGRQPDADETETSSDEEEEVHRFECDRCGRLPGSLRMYVLGFETKDNCYVLTFQISHTRESGI